MFILLAPAEYEMIISNLWVWTGGWGPGRKEAGGGRREGGKQGSQGGKNWEKLRKTAKHFILFDNRNGIKRRETLQKRVESERFRPPCPSNYNYSMNQNQRELGTKHFGCLLPVIFFLNFFKKY